MKEGLWREPVHAPAPWAQTGEDVAEQRDRDRARAHVRSATYQWSMGAGGVPELEVPLPGDEEALLCPDTSTKSEWDALWHAEDLIKRQGFGDERLHAVTAEQLRWVRPARQEAAGASKEEYAAALCAHPQPPGKSEVVVKLEALDPTQRAFADMVLEWARAKKRRVRGKRPVQPLQALLLGTAGTGKTTVLKAALEHLREEGVGVRVAAWTGVAASNVGEGAQTLSSLFHLSRINETSQEMEKLTGTPLKEFAKELAGLELLVIDEISMVSRVVLAQVSERLQEWRAQTGDVERSKVAFGGVGVILAGDFGQLGPIKEADCMSLLCPHLVPAGCRHKTANLGQRLFAGFETVVRLRRIHRQPGASVYKESLIRLRDGAMTQDDHKLWRQHDLGSAECTLDDAARKRFEREVSHLFSENAPAGARNGRMAGDFAREQARSVLRVASRDSSRQAEAQSCERFGQHRRVVHLVEGAPAMIIANLRTEAGLVNGATGTVLGAVLKESLGREDLRGAVCAGDVKYVVMDVPSYRGPVIFPGHPTWVPIQPNPVRHDRNKGWERLQLPLVLAWGITVHKSQGLTFPAGAVLDFEHSPTNKPVATVGLPFVAMSRTTCWEDQAFRDLPTFWEFRAVLKQELFRWRTRAEERFDKLHDETMGLLVGDHFSVETDVARHKAWSERVKERDLTAEELRDIREMLEIRGMRVPPEHPEEPVEDRRGPRGGGGRKRTMGMRAMPAKKTRLQGSGGARAAQESGEGEEPPEKRRRVDLGEAGPEDPGEEEYPDLADLPEEEQAWPEDFEDPDLFCPFEGFDDGDGPGLFGPFDGFDDGQDDAPLRPFGGAEPEEAEGGGVSLGEEMGWSRRGEEQQRRWGQRYFERQRDAECGQHALNNVLGAPQFRREDMERAARAVLAIPGTGREEEHIRARGWYSHSVLVNVLRNTAPAQWKLLFNRLGEADYHAFLADELLLGALVNQGDAHWIALVKHDGLLWEVDSQLSPKPMDEEAFRVCLRSYPSTHAVARYQHLGE